MLDVNLEGDDIEPSHDWKRKWLYNINMNMNDVYQIRHLLKQFNCFPGCIGIDITLSNCLFVSLSLFYKVHAQHLFKISISW